MSEKDRRNINENESVLDDGNDGNTNNNGDGDRRDEDNCPMIVNALLTFVMSIIRNSTDPKLVDLMGRYFDLQQVTDAKSILCDAAKLQFRRRQDSENRVEKMAHIRDIVDILRKLDRENAVPFFVVDSIGLASLPKLNAEDVSYVSVAEKVAEMYNKMEIMNDAIAANTVRSIDNEAKLKPVQPLKYAHVNDASHLDKQYPELKNAYRNTQYNGQNIYIPSRPRNPVELTRQRGVHHPVRMSGSRPVSSFRLPPLVTDPLIQVRRQSESQSDNVITSENQPPTSDSATAVQPAGGVQPTASSANPSCTAGTAALTGDNNNPPIATTAGSDITLTLVPSSGSAAPAPQSAEADASLNDNPSSHPVGGPLVHDEHLYYGRPNGNNYERARSDDSNSQRIQRPPGEPQNSGSVTSVRGATSNRGWEIPSSHARTFNRRNLQPITGTAAAGSVKGSFRNATDMFVSRVQQSTSDNDMMEFVQNKGVNLLDFQRMSHPESKFKSFKLTLSVPDYMFLYHMIQVNGLTEYV